MTRRRLLLMTGLTGLFLATATGWSEPRAELKAGSAAYATGAYEQAAEHFAAAAEQAQAENLDPAVARYNRATALYASGALDEASARFEEAVRTDDLPLQQKAHFNRGNALMGLSAREREQQQLETALTAAQQAMDMYETAINLDPRDEAAKVNYELALAQTEQLEQELQQQQQQQQQQQEDPSEEESSPDEPANDEQQQGEEEGETPPQEERPQPGEAPPSAPPDQSGEEEAQSPPPASEEMTPEEARMMLEAMREEEAAKREQLRVTLGQPVPVTKDW